MPIAAVYMHVKGVWVCGETKLAHPSEEATCFRRAHQQPVTQEHSRFRFTGKDMTFADLSVISMLMFVSLKLSQSQHQPTVTEAEDYL